MSSDTSAGHCFWAGPALKSVNVGDAVRHPAKPEWGVGEVVAVSADKIEVRFAPGSRSLTISEYRVGSVLAEGIGGYRKFSINIRSASVCIALGYTMVFPSGDTAKPSGRSVSPSSVPRSRSRPVSRSSTWSGGLELGSQAT